MNILYVIDYDLNASWFGGAQRTRLLYNALCKLGDVYVLRLGAKGEKDAVVSNRYGRVSIRFSGYNRLIRSIFKKIFGLRPPIMWYSRPVRDDVASFFPGVKFDIVVKRYLADVGVIPLWKIAPLFVDLDDYPMQIIETTLFPQISKWRRPLLRVFEERCIEMCLEKVSGVWLSNPSQLSLIGNRLRCGALENIPYINCADSKPESPRGNYIFTLGNMKYEPNIYGIAEFLESFWPSIHRAFPDLEYHILGRGLASDLSEKWASVPGVKIMGFVENVGNVYNRAIASIVPVRMGGGTCIKTLESLAYSRICISTEFGARGIAGRLDGYSDIGLLVYKTPQECLNYISKAINDPEWRLKLETNAKVFISRTYSEDKFFEQVRRLICHE